MSMKKTHIEMRIPSFSTPPREQQILQCMLRGVETNWKTKEKMNS